MPKKPKKSEKPATPDKGGRPKKEINWPEVAKLISYNCTQIEIADFCGCCVDTLNNASMRDNGIGFSDFFEQKKGGGKWRLRKIQWALAEQGSAAMAIFLGKHLLGQTDVPMDKEILEATNRAGLSREQVIDMINRQAVEIEQKRQTAPRRSFEAFCELAAYPKPYPKQLEMRAFVIDELGPHLLLGSRGYGKSDYGTILGTAYDIYLHPMASKNLIVTKSKERNAAMIAEIAKALRANGVALEKENSTSIRIAGLHGKDHSVSAVTIKSVSLRGRHPSRVIMDDPVTEDDASEATRAMVEKKYYEIFKLCPNIAIIGQPVHKFDLYAKLRPLLKKMEVPHGTIPELDADLEAQRLAGVSEASISASYHLKVLAEGTVPFEAIKYIDKFPTGESAVAWIDPSYKGVDYTAISIIKAYGQGIAVVGYCYRKAWNHCLDDIVPMLKKFNVKKLAFECNALGDQPVIMLRQLINAQKLGIGVIGRDSILNKHSKIMNAGTFAHQIHLSKESDRVYTDQVVQYEYKAENDDAPDSLASCLEWIGLVRGKR